MDLIIRNALMVLVVLAVAVPTAWANEEKIEFLVLVDQQNEAFVAYWDESTRAKMSLFNPLSGISNAAKSFKGGYVGAKYAETLNSNLNGFHNGRLEDFSSTLVGQFEQNSEFFMPDVREISSSPELVRSEKPNYKSLDQAGVRFVLIITEQSGLATPETNPGELAPAMIYEARFFDVKSKRRLFKEKLLSLHGSSLPAEAALASDNLFQDAYPDLHRSLAHRLYYRLNGTDVLHHMAASSGLGDSVPSIANVLKEYASAFSFERPKLRDWKDQKTRNDYVYVSAPKKHKKYVAIVTDIDLMIEEFGQHDIEFADYLETRRSRLQDAGWNLDSYVDNEMVQAGSGWITYVLDNPRGGKSVFFHRKVSQDFSLNHEIVILGNDTSSMIDLYHDDFVRYLAETRLSE